MSSNAGVMQQVQESADLRRVYGEQLDKKRGHWFALGRMPLEGDSRLYAFAVAQTCSGLEGLVLHLRFAETPPYAEVEVIDRETF